MSLCPVSLCPGTPWSPLRAKASSTRVLINAHVDELYPPETMYVNCTTSNCPPTQSWQNHSKWTNSVQKKMTKWKMVKSEVSSNFAQNDSKWALIIISSDFLAHFSQKVDQKWKIVKTEVDSNFAQNDSK